MGVFLNGISQIRNGIKAQLLSLVVFIVHTHIHIGENMVAVIIVTLDFARPDLLEPEAAFKFLRQLYLEACLLHGLRQGAVAFLVFLVPAGK